MNKFVDFFLRSYQNADIEELKKIKAFFISILLCFIMTTAGLVMQIVSNTNFKYLLVLAVSYSLIVVLILLIKFNLYKLANNIFNIFALLIITFLQLTENCGHHFDIYRHTASLLFGLFVITLLSHKKIQPIIYSTLSLLSFTLIVLHNYFLHNMVIDKEFYEALIGSSILIILCNLTSIVILSMIEERMESIKKANNELIKLNIAKKNANHLVSHELKSPITCIYGFANVVREYMKKNQNALKMEDFEYISDKNDTIINECNRLLKLINNYLNFSMMETGENNFVFEKTSIKDVALHSQKIFLPKINEKRIMLINDFDEDIPEVYCDQDKLSQVFINLFSNSLKFTKEGYIRCKIKKESDFIYTSIEDTGLGIDPKYIGYIFEKFNKIPKIDSTVEKGSGLGLSICREIIRKHNGNIWVESEPNKGTKFCFSIPIKSVSE